MQNKEYQEYYDLLVKEMKKQGATDADLNLISKEMIENAIKNNKKPSDLAWAILQ